MFLKKVRLDSIVSELSFLGCFVGEKSVQFFVKTQVDVQTVAFRFYFHPVL